MQYCIAVKQLMSKFTILLVTDENNIDKIIIKI